MSHMPHLNDAVAALARELQSIFGARLQAVVAYGVHEHAHADTASGHEGHGHGRRAPLHTLVLVQSLTADDLKTCAGRVQGWHDAGLSTPLVLPLGEFERSLDAFPLEFGAMLADHEVVFGQNPFDNLRVEDVDLRR